MKKLIVVGLFVCSLSFGQILTPTPTKVVKHPKWHKFVSKVDTVAKTSGEIILASATVAVVVMASSGTPIQIR